MQCGKKHNRFRKCQSDMVAISRRSNMAQLRELPGLRTRRLDAVPQSSIEKLDWYRIASLPVVILGNRL